MADEDRRDGNDGSVEEKVDHLIQQLAALRMEVAELRLMLVSAQPAEGVVVAPEVSPPSVSGDPPSPTGGAQASAVSERRASPRHRVHMAVEYTVIDAEDASGLFSADTVDVSRNGLGFYSPRPLGPGTVLAVTVGSMDLFATVDMVPQAVQYLEEDVLIVGATVVHCRRDPEENRYRVGVCFLCVNDETEREELIAHMKKARRRKR